MLLVSAIIWFGLYQLFHGSDFMMWFGAAFGYVFSPDNIQYYAHQFEYEYVDEITFVPAVVITFFFYGRDMNTEYD